MRGDSRPDYALLARVFGARATPAEAAALERWVGDDPDRRAEIERLRLVWGVVGESPVPRRSAAAWARIAPQLQRGSARLRHTWPRRVGGKVPAYGLWRTAGQVVTTVSVLGMLAVIPRLTGFWPSAQRFREFVSASGSRVTVTFHDGTRLVLGPASRLRMPADFGRTERQVELDGEAQLTVVHDAGHPFAVRTTQSLIRDVGTTFVVQAYAGDGVEHVAVQQGQVSLAPIRGHAGPSQALAVGDVATVVANAISVVHRTDLTTYVAWAQGRLVFDATPLRDVARELGRTFDVDITVADSTLAAIPVTGAFTDQPVDLILDDVTAVLGLAYKRIGRTVVIRHRDLGARNHRDPRPSVSSS